MLAHELTHVTQRHIARSIAAASSQASLMALAGLLLGVLAAAAAQQRRRRQAAIIGSQAAAVQGQLNFSRDMEREADRVGLRCCAERRVLAGGHGRDVRALDHATRLNDNGAYPYLRSHPLTTERICEAQRGWAPARRPQRHWSDRSTR